MTLVEFVFERMLAGQVRRYGPVFARGPNKGPVNIQTIALP